MFLTNSSKSSKNLLPNITGSLAFLSPKRIFFDFIVVDEVSILTSVTEFKFIELKELNNIESDLEFNNNLPEFNIICSPLYSLGRVGGEKYDK